MDSKTKEEIFEALKKTKTTARKIIEYCKDYKQQVKRSTIDLEEDEIKDILDNINNVNQNIENTLDIFFDTLSPE